MTTKYSTATKLRFNPDGMTVRELKAAAKTLRSLIQDFDRAHEHVPGRRYQPEHDVYLSMLQIADHWIAD